MIRAAGFQNAIAGCMLFLVLNGAIPSQGAASDQAAQLKLETILETRDDLSAINTPLRDIVSGLATKHGFDVRFDKPEIAARWISLDEPTSVSLSGLSIRSILRVVLQDHGLEARFEEGLVVIGCKKQPRVDLRHQLHVKGFSITGVVQGVPKVAFLLVLKQIDDDGRFDLANVNLPKDDHEGRRRLIAQQAVYSKMGGSHTKELLASSLQSRLRRHIDAEHFICGMTDSQREKLELAGRSDVQQLVDLAEQLCDQFMESYEPGEGRVELPEDFPQGIHEVMRGHQRGLFDRDTRYARTRRRLLTEAQIRKVRIVSSFRGMDAVVRTNSDRGPGVFEILLSSCPINETVLSNLAMFPELETLSLESTAITDNDLGHLKSVPRLISLELCNTRVGDEGLKHVATLVQLERLRLDGTRVTDGGIEILVSLKNLKFLDVSGTAVTQAGVSRLQSEIPELKITR